ncbi:MAG: T9SS type A sorting domain-containing protein [Sphingobacteriales bacterium]|nr:MAG: T9SS type A sorting domain-containing protein [Sphingobacteriales bacterium]
MKKIFTSVLLLISSCAFAQPDGMVFSVTSEPYTNLTGVTPLVSSGWDDFGAKIPLTFSFSLFGATTDTLYMDEDSNIGAEMLFRLDSITQGLTFLTDLTDRSNGGKDSSRISYRIQSAGGQKIAKIEYQNAGFYFDQSTSYDDSVNFQVWLKEGSNDIEVHYGPSGIQTPAIDLFTYENPVFAFFNNINPNSFSLDWIYYVSSTSPAVVDSMDGNDFADDLPFGFSTWPADGTVFRFTHTTNGVHGVKLNEYAEVYPTAFDETFFVQISEPSFKGEAFLIDMNGRIVGRKSLQAGKNDISMLGEASGHYILNIRSVAGSVFYKVIKN